MKHHELYDIAKLLKNAVERLDDLDTNTLPTDEWTELGEIAQLVHSCSCRLREEADKALIHELNLSLDEIATRGAA